MRRLTLCPTPSFLPRGQSLPLAFALMLSLGPGGSAAAQTFPGLRLRGTISDLQGTPVGVT